MSKKHEVMPTEELCPQLTNALEEIGLGNFRIMTDGFRPDIVRPVLYEAVFFNETNELTSQKVIYTASEVRRPEPAQRAIDRVVNAIKQLTDPATNPVRYAIEEQAKYPDDRPYFLDEILPKIDAQSATNTARVIGGLLMVKDAITREVGLRCVYNRALMEARPTWELKELASLGALGSSESTKDIEARTPDALGDIAARMVLHCLAASQKLKPTLIFAPNLGILNL